MVTLGSEISLLGYNSKLAIKFGRIFPKEDCYSLNYKEKHNRRWFLKWEYGLILTLRIIDYTNESKFQGVKENTDLFNNKVLKNLKFRRGD